MTRKQQTGLVAALFCLFPLLIILFIPVGLLQETIQRVMADQGYSITADRFGKAFPLGLTAQKVTIADTRGPLLRFDSFSLRPAFFPLLTGRAALSARAVIGTGTINVLWESGSRGGISADLDRISLEQIPFFVTATGAAVQGTLRGEVRLSGPPLRMNGTVKLEARNASCSDLKIGEMPLPAVRNETLKGMIRVKDGRGRVESLTLDGGGVYARLHGDIPLAASAPLDLTLELMPTAETLEKQKFIFLLLVKYLVSPGYYRLPVQGTPARPQLL